jgi:Glycosyltransferase 61
MGFKQTLVREFGIEKGFRFYCSALGLRSSARLHLRPVQSLRDFAAERGLSFAELHPSGEAYEIEPAAVIGPADQVCAAGAARSFFVACLGNARISSRSAFIEADGHTIFDFQADELARTNDQLELDPAVFHSANDDAWVIDEAWNDEFTLNEAFGSLLGPHSNSFGEWLWEYIPKLVLSATAGLLPAMPVLIDSAMPANHRRALEFMLPKGSTIIELTPSATARVRRLWCAPALMHHPLLERNVELHCFPPRRFAPILADFAKRAETIPPTEARPSRVYFSRPDHLRRKLINREAIEAIVTSRGFTIVYPENHDFVEQVALVRDARFLVGPEGSAMFLNFFARSGMKLCILNHSFTLGLIDYTGLFREAGVDVTVFTGPAVRLNNDPGFPNFGLPQYADYEIDEPRFADFLDDWLVPDS